MFQIEMAMLAGGDAFEVKYDEENKAYATDLDGNRVDFSIDYRTIRRWRAADEVKEANDGKPLRVKKPTTMSKSRSMVSSEDLNNFAEVYMAQLKDAGIPRDESGWTFNPRYGHCVGHLDETTAMQSKSEGSFVITNGWIKTGGLKPDKCPHVTFTPFVTASGQKGPAQIITKGTWVPMKTWAVNGWPAEAGPEPMWQVRETAWQTQRSFLDYIKRLTWWIRTTMPFEDPKTGLQIYNQLDS